MASAPTKRTREASMRFLDVRALRRRRPPPLAWLIEGLCARGALTLLAGQPKAGKSLLALALAAGVAAGEEVAGIGCRPGGALIVDAENGQDEIHRRLWSLELDARVANKLHILTAHPIDLRTDLERLERRIAARAPDLLVLDCLRSLWAGSERSDREVEALLGELRHLATKRRLAILLAHHTTKGGEGYRGSNAICAGVDIAATLTAPQGDPDRARRLLEVFATRLGPAPEPVHLRLQSQAGWLRIEGAAPPPRRARARGGLRAQIIAATTKAGDWCDQAELAQALGRAPSEGSLRRALQALESERKLEQRRMQGRRQWRLTLAFARKLMAERGR